MAIFSQKNQGERKEPYFHIFLDLFLFCKMVAYIIYQQQRGDLMYLTACNTLISVFPCFLFSPDAFSPDAANIRRIGTERMHSSNSNF